MKKIDYLRGYDIVVLYQSNGVIYAGTAQNVLFFLNQNLEITKKEFIPAVPLQIILYEQCMVKRFDSELQ